MARTILLMIVLSITFAGFAQKRVIAPETLRNQKLINYSKQALPDILDKSENPLVKSAEFSLDEEQIGDTRYDNQSNASIPNRIHRYPDGTIGAIWTRGLLDPTFTDRGAGYNYFDGNEWDAWPASRVENVTTNRPTYTAWGENGEMIVSHQSGTGLILSTREEKGTGSWDYSTYSGPASQPYILWNRAITSGPDHNRVHLLALTLPTTHGGTPYLGLDGALLYSYSMDGGATWYWQNEVLEGMSSSEYTGFSADIYSFAEPKDDVVAFVVGDSWCDLFLMKSTDGGETFNKTVIWHHPYPLWQFGTPTDTFYCADGSQHLVIDNSGMVHVAFGITRALADAENTYWYPWVDGIAYWNENMPAFSDNVNALSPYGDAGTELVEDYNLIGWTQDVNQNGSLDFEDDLGSYFIGLSSMPQLVLDETNHLFLVYSSVTETYSSGNKNYRHLWARGSGDGGVTWEGFTDLTSDLLHIFDECVYPSCAAGSDDKIYLVYQSDIEPGTAVWGSQHPYVDNKIVFMSVSKTDLITVGMSETKPIISEMNVSQNYPNPFRQTSEVSIILNESASLNFEISSLTGQKVYEASIADAKPGLNTLTIDAATLTPGIYFYRVRAGDSSVTKKMIIE
jgi:hypothetical protein